MALIAIDTSQQPSTCILACSSKSVIVYGSAAFVDLKEYVDYINASQHDEFMKMDMIYRKYKNQQKHFLHFKAFVKVRHMWKVLRKDHRIELIQKFIKQWETNEAGLAPARNMLDHFLVCCLQLHCKLQHIYAACVTAWIRCDKQLQLGHFVKLTLVLMTVLARMRTLALTGLSVLQKTYNMLYPLRQILPNTTAVWFPDDVTLPVSVKQFDSSKLNCNVDNSFLEFDVRDASDVTADNHQDWKEETPVKGGFSEKDINNGKRSTPSVNEIHRDKTSSVLEQSCLDMNALFQKDGERQQLLSVAREQNMVQPTGTQAMNKKRKRKQETTNFYESSSLLKKMCTADNGASSSFTEPSQKTKRRKK